MPEQQPIITPDQVNAQIDQYLGDPSIHQGGSVYGNGGAQRAQNIVGGQVGRYTDHGVRMRTLDVEGAVDGQQMSADIVTENFGSGGTAVNRAHTSAGDTTYSSGGYGDHAHVSRKTEDGGEYSHSFRDPAKIAKASELITSLASKRASRIVATGNKSNPERKAA